MAEALVRQGILHPEALKILIEGVDGNLSFLSLGALSQYAGPSGLLTLIDGLHNARPRVRAGVARILGSIGPEASIARDAIASLMADQDQDVRLAAAESYARLGGEPTRALSVLLSL